MLFPAMGCFLCPHEAAPHAGCCHFLDGVFRYQLCPRRMREQALVPNSALWVLLGAVEEHNVL